MTRERPRYRTTREISEATRVILDRHLRPGEEPIAQGRADLLRHVRDVSVGSGHTFLLITSERLLWTSLWGTDPVESVSFGSIESVQEGRYQHRYVVALRHEPAGGGRTETMFKFSRWDTTAARALRDRIGRLGVPVDRLALPTPPPREQAASLVVLPPRWAPLARLITLWRLRRAGRG